jgi:lipopolysaccharide heptosyltransferase II
MNTKDISRILIIKPSSLGDVIHTLPLLKALRDQLPAAYIAWLISPEFKDIIEGNPYLDRIFLFQKEKWGRPYRIPLTIKEFFLLIRQIRRERFQLAIDVQGLLRSSIVAYFSRAPYRVGFENAREFSPIFYNQKVLVPNVDIHAVDRYLSLIPGKRDEPAKPEFPLQIPEMVRDNMRDILRQNQVDINQQIFLINPGAKWNTKRWPVKNYACLVQYIKEQFGGHIILIGGNGDKQLAEEVASYSRSNLTVLTGKTSLKQLAALMQMSTLLITNDSGPMHLANAVGTPTVAIFGPTNPIRTGPYHGNYIVVRRELSCIPCYLRKCPTGQECLQELGVDQVMVAVNQIMETIRCGA